MVSGNLTAQNTPTRSDADESVEKGLFWLGAPYSHGILRGGNVITSSSHQNQQTSKSQRLKLAIIDFQNALVSKSSLKEYETESVKNYLAISYCKLGNINQGVNESIDAKVFFSSCFAQYEQLLENRQMEMIPFYAAEYIQGIIDSENLNFALSKIKELRDKKFRLRPLNFLNKLEGDIYFLLGQKAKAGITYEKWIKFGTGFHLIDSNFLDRLKRLKIETGHPNVDIDKVARL